MNPITEKRTYNDFLTGLSDGLLRELGGEYETRAVTNTRNNGILRNGILIRKREESIAPAIYLDKFYEEYCCGRGLSDIIRQVLYTYRESAKEGGQYGFESIALSPEQVKEKLIFRIVNYPKNAAMLKEVPHIRFLNLAVFFQIMVYQHQDGIGTVCFTLEHYRDYSSGQPEGKALFSSMKELYQLALNNTMRLFPARLSAMEDIMESILKGREAPALPFMAETAAEPVHSLYVLSNISNINGAGCLMYPELLNHLRNFFHSDFYILPSSIHEVILLPARASVKREELNDMIREINLTQVPADEVLSDRAYYSEEFFEVLLTLSKDSGFGE